MQVLHGVSLLQVSPRKSFVEFSFRQPFHMTLTSHSPWSDQPNDICWTALITKILIMRFLPSPLASSHLDLNIFLSTPLLNITKQPQQAEFSMKYLFAIWFLFACFYLNKILNMTFKTEIEEPHKIKYPKMVAQNFVHPSGTVRPLYGTGVLLLSRERFLYI